MIFSAPFKKTIFISLLGHFAVFSIFSFSFGSRLPAANYSAVFFWGQILGKYDLTASLTGPARSLSSIKKVFIKVPDKSALDKTDRGLTLIAKYYSPAIAGSRPILNDWREKPAVDLGFSESKIDFIPKLPLTVPALRRKEPTLIFHPLLPYHFTLYFSDRQKVHIELMFNIASGSKTNSIAIKRKISSGNLEADLLVMRYIGHYLFIQQSRFLPDSWQSVKIDLSEASRQ